MKALLFLSFLILFSLPSSLKAQQCDPPESVVLNIYISGVNEVYLTWAVPDSGCIVSHYEIEYSDAPFTPGMGQGVFISPVSSALNSYELPYIFPTYAWIRAVCDCTDNFPDTEPVPSPWVEGAWNIIEVEPPLPGPGHSCSDAPIEPVESDENCGNAGEPLVYRGAYVNSIEEETCTGNLEYLLWREFNPSLGSVVNVSMESFDGDDFGFMIIVDSCDGAVVHCEPSFSSADAIQIANLDINSSYFIASWINDLQLSPPPEETTASVDLNICYPDCAPPFDMAFWPVNDANAELSWPANGSSSWVIEYGPVGFELGTGTVIEDISGSSIGLSGLDAETEYDVYISAVCDGGMSPYGVFSFTTTSSIWITGGIGNSTVYCCDSLDIPENISVASSCPPIVYSHEDLITGEGCDYTIERTITATDDCGSAVEQTFMVTVLEEGIEQTISADEYLEIDCALGIPGEEYDLGDGWCDAPEVSVESSGAFVCGDTLVRTYTALGTDGYLASTVQYVVALDEESPQLDCPETMTILIPDGSDSHVIPDLFQSIEVTDNCDGSPVSNQSMPVGTVVEPGDYAIELTAIDECGNQTWCTLNYQVTFFTGLDDFESLGISMMPNPSDDRVELRLGDAYEDYMSIVLYDISGRVVLNQRVQSSMITVDVSNLSEGVYAVHVLNAKGQVKLVSTLMVE